MYQRGQRIELVRTTDTHTELGPGDQGTVHSYNAALSQLNISWDSGSTLSMLLDDGDEVRVLD